MPKTVTVALREPIVGHQGTISEIVLRGPTLPEYMRIGDLYSFFPAPDGKTMAPVRNDAAFAAYAEACVVEPKDKLLLQQVQLADAMGVEDAIEGFFIEARRARQLPTSPTSSSSTSS